MVYLHGKLTFHSVGSLRGWQDFTSKCFLAATCFCVGCQAARGLVSSGISLVALLFPHTGKACARKNSLLHANPTSYTCYIVGAVPCC